MVWIRLSQRCSYAKEIEALTNGKDVPKGSNIHRLSPRWFADDSTLRISGRLDYSNFTNDEKHPMIVPSEHNLTKLLIQDAHQRTMHGGPQLCIALIRQRCWIPNIRRMVRKYIDKNCVQCIRHSKTTLEQFMAPLPSSRVTPAPPFSRVGVDFAGPFTLRKAASTSMQLRKAVTTFPKEPTTIKGWVVVFICMVTRAVHLDVVRGLNVEAFLECFSRLTSRRGLCSEIWSDNGTTFVGADNELKRVLEGWNNQFPIQQLADLGTTWKFITPAAPFQGGIWEAAVKSFKHHFRRTLGPRILTSDQMYTLVTQIEACMNARPLFPQSDDASDLSPITPAHLVIGRSTLQRPYTENVEATPDNRLTLWGLQQKMYQQFWRSWKEDYVLNLQKRNKWYKIHLNLKLNDMVIIRDENTPPTSWPVGRVVGVTKSRDGLIRSATVKIPCVKIDKTTKKRVISTTILNRPIQKLCILIEDTNTPPQYTPTAN